MHDGQDQHIGLLMYRMEQVEERSSDYDKLFQEIVKTQHLLSERIVALETKEEANAQQITKLNSSNGLQTKLLVGIVSSSIVTLITLLFKFVGAIK